MIALFKALFVWILAGAVARVLAGAGLALGTYSILSGLLDDFLSLLTGSLNGVTSGFSNLLWLAGVGEAISIVGSALVAVAAINSARVFIGRSS